MFRTICFIPIILATVLMPNGPLAAQTHIHGKLLSVDGRTLPKTVISFQRENPGDLFNGYEDVYAESDGSYSLTIREPGLYNITFRGIYHRQIRVPVLVIDQPVIEMDVLLLPIYFDDGRYFENDEYLYWIRVIGNFNNYDFLEGPSFSRNDDGSISAFIPVTSDTVRYQVKGLGVGSSTPLPLPLADEYHIRENRSFESVLYHNVPADSLEIRYMPGETVPFQNMLTYREKREWWNVSGFISFKNRKDRYWTEPVYLVRNLGGYFGRPTPIIEQDLASGLTAGEQVDYLEKYFSEVTSDELMEIKQRVYTALSSPDIHPQQQSMLYLAYAGVLNRVEMRKRKLTHMQQQMQDTFDGGTSEEIEDELQRLEEITIDKNILLQIPNQVVPAHPVWNYVQLLPQFLLNVTDGHPDFIDYFMEIIQYHPHEFTIQRVALALIRELAGDFETVEEMEVYKIIVERFGEGDLARRAHETFRVSRPGLRGGNPFPLLQKEK